MVKQVCSYSGDCPECKCGESESWTLNIGRDHWEYCRRHKTKWHVGSNLYSSWQHETEADWQRNSELLEGYREVEPRFCQRCHGQRWYTRIRKAMARRLRWLADWLDGLLAGKRTRNSDWLPF